MVDNSIHHRIVRNESNDLHLSAALWTKQRVHLIDFPDHLGPASAGNPGALLLDDQKHMTSFDRLYGRVAEVGRPVLLIWGREDKTVPFALNETVRRAIPGAAFHAIDGAAHLPHLERPDVVNLLLLEFLRVHSSAAGTR